MKTWLLAGVIFIGVLVIALIILGLKPDGEKEKPAQQAERVDWTAQTDYKFKPAAQKRYPDLDLPSIMSRAPSLQGYAYMAEVLTPTDFLRDQYKGMALGCFALRRKDGGVSHAIYAHDDKRFLRIAAADDLTSWIDSGCAAAVDKTPTTLGPVQALQLLMSWMPPTLEYAAQRERVARQIRAIRR